jgi:hypothetical protein
MENKVTVSQIGLRYGLILGLVFVVFGLILQMTGLATNNWISSISYVFLIIAIVMGHNAFKEGSDGFMSIGQGIGIGTLMSLIAGTLSSIFTYIYIKFIDDSMMQMIKDKQIESMEAQGMDDAQIDQAMEIAGKFTSPEMILVFGILAITFFGFILALIISLFTKKSNPALEV